MFGNYIAIFGNVGSLLILIAMLVWFWDATQLIHREQVWESWTPLGQHQLFLIRLLPVCKCKYHLNPVNCRMT